MDSIASKPVTVSRWLLSARCLALPLLIAVIATLAPPLHAQTKATEYQVKAAYLFNFAKFVKWPSDSASARSSSFEICVLGQDPFDGALDATVGGEKIDAEPVAIRRIDHVSESKSCRILFISRSEESRLTAILTEVDSSDTLTVSDIPRFSKRGGMIEFMPEGNRVRFGINLDSAERSRLTVSSDLLKVATTVITSTRAGGLS
jgi:YfiR/HmsC-like